MLHILEKKATSKPDNKLTNIPTQLEYSNNVYYVRFYDHVV